MSKLHNIMLRGIANLIDSFVLVIAYLISFYLLNIQSNIMSIILVLAVELLIEFSFYKKGTTLGKESLGLKIIDNQTKKNLSFVKILIRENIGKIISSIYFLGYIFIFFSKNNQTLHDKLVNSLVVEQH
ncbi:RDD family protein [Peptostreptococcaceae bacterium AGR-M142]